MQYTSRLLMVEPVQFGYNSETAVNNIFQHKPSNEVQSYALNEFNRFVALLRANKINVTVVKDTASPATPDSIFPNNWISFHEDSSIVLYPMFAANRRQERKPHILEELEKSFLIQKVYDLTGYEKQGLFLEGTGSMVLDRKNKIAYACLSARTNPDMLYEFCKLKGYTPVVFTATDINGKEIYHTNVMMCISDSLAIICLESVSNSREIEKLIGMLGSTNKEILPISLEQLHHFAGNMLQVVNSDGVKCMVMSTCAYASLNEIQLAAIKKQNRIIHSSLDHIENAGGGSARCMMAEIFLNPV